MVIPNPETAVVAAPKRRRYRQKCWFHGGGSRHFLLLLVPAVFLLCADINFWKDRRPSDGVPPTNPPPPAAARPRVVKLAWAPSSSPDAQEETMALPEGGIKDTSFPMADRGLKPPKRQRDTEWYDDHMRDSLYEGDCVPMHPWQETLFPTCNTLHETGMGHVAEQLSFLDHGGYNQVFTFLRRNLTDDASFRYPQLRRGESPGEDDEVIVWKVLKYDTDYTDRNYDRVRRDVLISERTTRSAFIVDVLASCGFSQLAPYAPGGDLGEYVNAGDLPKGIKLRLAVNVANALRDLHDIDGDGVPSVTHGDLKHQQFVRVDGGDVSDPVHSLVRFKLGDFNRGRFLRRNNVTGEPCPYTIGKNDGKWRSPHEYIKRHPLTSAIDVWALGSILFKVLTGESVWKKEKNLRKAEEMIARTESAPPLPPRYAESNDPVDVLFRYVMYEMCFVADPDKRAAASDVAEHLIEESKKLGYADLIEFD